eukprot:gene26057-31461_t
MHYSSALYSTYSCLGGSQRLERGELTRYSNKYPHLNDAQSKVCHFENICFTNEHFVFFMPERVFNTSDELFFQDMTFNGFKDDFLVVGIDRHFIRPAMKIASGPVPTDLPFDQSEVGFWLGNSNAYNYAHYLIDTVLSSYIGARLFNLNFTNGRQLFESSCKNFGANSEAVADQKVPYNSSMGSYRTACLDRLNSFWQYFFDHKPSFMEPVYTTDRCYRHVIAGLMPSFHVFNHVPTRGFYMREFRDLIISRLPLPNEDKSSTPAPQLKKKKILVALRSPGHAGGELVADLCAIVRSACRDVFADFNSSLTDPQELEFMNENAWEITCVHPQHLSFIDELRLARNTQLFVSVHGTISYVSAFARDQAQQIVLSHHRELKEYTTLFHSTTLDIYRIMVSPSLDSSMRLYLGHALEKLMAHGLANTYTYSRHRFEKEVHMQTEDLVNYPSRADSFHGLLPKEGAVVRAMRSRQLFFIKYGKKCPIASMDTVASLNNPQIYVLSDQELLAIPEGPPYTL